MIPCLEATVSTATRKMVIRFSDHGDLAADLKDLVESVLSNLGEEDLLSVQIVQTEHPEIWTGEIE